MQYPPPSYAAHIWWNAGQLMVGFPPVDGHHTGHTVAFPINEAGLKLLVHTLRERSHGATIGAQGEPTTYQVERSLVKDKKYNEWLRVMQANDKESRTIEDLLDGLLP